MFFRRGELLNVCLKCGIADDGAVGFIITSLFNITGIESFLFHTPYDLPPASSTYTSTDAKLQVKENFLTWFTISILIQKND